MELSTVHFMVISFGIVIYQIGNQHVHGTSSANHSIYGNDTITGAQSNTTNVTFDPCQSPTSPSNAYYAVFLLVVILTTIIGNSMVCLGVYMSSSLRERATNWFLVSLAISDIMVALVTLPIKVRQSLDNQLFCMGVGACWVLYLSDVTFSIASVTNLAVIATDRYIAITRPFKYSMCLTCHRARYVIVGVWIYAIAWSLVSTFKWHEPISLSTSVFTQPGPYCINDNRIYFTVLYGCVFVAPLVAITVMYSAIVREAAKQVKAITQLDINRVRRRKMEFRATRTVAVVFGVFVICWLPACVISISSSWFTDHYRQLKSHNRALFLGIYMTFVQILPPLNSTANPFIYAIFNRTFRESFRVILARVFLKDGHRQRRFNHHNTSQYQMQLTESSIHNR